MMLDEDLQLSKPYSAPIPPINMKTASSILCLALPLLAGAAPSVEKREMCNVFNNDGAVKCRSSPYFDAHVVTTIGDGDAWDFSCYKSGDCYEGVW